MQNRIRFSSVVQCDALPLALQVSNGFLQCSKSALRSHVAMCFRINYCLFFFLNATMNCPRWLSLIFRNKKTGRKYRRTNTERKCSMASLQRLHAMLVVVMVLLTAAADCYKTTVVTRLLVRQWPVYQIGANFLLWFSRKKKKVTDILVLTVKVPIAIRCLYIKRKKKTSMFWSCLDAQTFTMLRWTINVYSRWQCQFYSRVAQNLVCKVHNLCHK